MSLPAGERGLKLALIPCNYYIISSLPAGERGLKLASIPSLAVLVLVAPRWGAGIEIAPVSASVGSLVCRSPLGSGD